MKSRRLRKKPRLVKKTRRNRRQRGGLLSLIHAARDRRKADAMDILHTIDANHPDNPEEIKRIVDEPDDEGYTALSYAMDHPDDDALVLELLTRGATVDEDNVDTLWKRAVDHRNIPLIQLILQHDNLILDGWLDYAVGYYNKNYPTDPKAKDVLRTIGNRYQELNRLPVASATNTASMGEFLRTWRRDSPIALIRHQSAQGVEAVADPREEVNLSHDDDEDIDLPNEFGIPVRHEFDPLDARYVLPAPGAEAGSGETHYIYRTKPAKVERLRMNPLQFWRRHNPNATYWNGGPGFFERPEPHVNEAEAFPFKAVTPRKVVKVEDAVALGGKHRRTTRRRSRKQYKKI